MNRRFILTSVSVVLLCIAGLGGYIYLRASTEKQYLSEAKQAVEVAVDELSGLPGFEVVQKKVVSFTLYPPRFLSSPRCYYGRSYIMLGANDVSVDAVGTYIKKSEEVGWKINEDQDVVDVILHRDSKERLVIISREPSIALQYHMDAYKDAKNSFSTIMFVIVDVDKKVGDTTC